MAEEKATKTYLIQMIGNAGSGKSYFARRLAKERGWVRFNSDSLRMAVFGSRAGIADQPLEVRREGIFRGIDYVTQEVLKSGVSVVFDANNNKKYVRKAQYVYAKRLEATPIALYVSTPKSVSIERAQERRETVDQRKFKRKEAEEIIERHTSMLDLPGSDENTITIDGTASFSEQLKDFNGQLKELGL